VDPEHAERIVASGVADAVGMTRALIADPELAAKALGGEARRVLFAQRVATPAAARTELVRLAAEARAGRQ